MVNTYYQKHKERLLKEARERYQKLSEKKKIIGKKNPEKDIKVLLKRKKEKERKKKLPEYRRNYYLTHKK